GKGAQGWLDGAPDVAVEVLGDAQSTMELMRKALEYLRAGGKMVWVLDPETRQVSVVTPPDHLRVLDSTEVLDGGEALPGFACPAPLGLSWPTSQLPSSASARSCAGVKGCLFATAAANSSSVYMPAIATASRAVSSGPLPLRIAATRSRGTMSRAPRISSCWS